MKSKLRISSVSKDLATYASRLPPKRKEEEWKVLQGWVGLSPLWQLYPEFDPIFDIPLDKMHNIDLGKCFSYALSVPLHSIESVCLGLIKKLIQVVFIGKETGKHACRTKLLNDALNCTRLPSELPRKSREINGGPLKGTEFFQIGVHSLPNILVILRRDQVARVWARLIFLYRTYMQNDEKYREISSIPYALQVLSKHKKSGTFSSSFLATSFFCPYTSCCFSVMLSERFTLLNKAFVFYICRVVDLKEEHEKLYQDWAGIFGGDACSYNVHIFTHMPLMRERHGAAYEYSCEQSESLYSLFQNCFVKGTPSIMKQLLTNGMLRVLHVKHVCQKYKQMTIKPDSGAVKTDDSLFACNDGLYKCAFVVQPGRLYRASKLHTVPFSTAFVGVDLPWEMVGMFKMIGAESDTVPILHDRIIGKVVRAAKTECLSIHNKEWLTSGCN